MTGDPNLLGEYLRARRELVTPDQVGIPVLGHRRVAGLRREEVAMLAGISAEYYLRLEQGRDRHPSAQVLQSIARVLQLEDDSYLLALSYAGGADGMETTDRLLAELGTVLSPRGCAYVLLCAQNRPDLVRRRATERLGEGWRAETVGSSGKTAGWVKLQVVRIWNDAVQ